MRDVEAGLEFGSITWLFDQRHEAQKRQLLMARDVTQLVYAAVDRRSRRHIGIHMYLKWMHNIGKAGAINTHSTGCGEGLL